MAMTPAVVGLLLLGAPAARLELVAPADGFVEGRETAVAIAVLDSSGALTDAAGAPVVTGASGPPSRIADGLWQVPVVPSGPDVAIAATLGSASGNLRAKAAASPEVFLTLSDQDKLPGERGSVIAVVDVRLASGEPFDGATPRLAATMAAVGPLKRIGPGKWSATVRLSDKKYPHATLIVASVPGSESVPAAAAVTLRGRALLPVTSEPGARITVRVGRRSWGPLPAGPTGTVEAAIEAGPADTSMEVESLDAAGNRSTRTLPLDLPPYPRLWAEAFAGATGLDGNTRVTVVAATLDRHGAVGGDAPSAIVAGRAIPLKAIPGRSGSFAGSASLALQPGKHAVTIASGNDTVTAPIVASAPPAVAIALEVAGDGRLAIGAPPLAVTARRIDARGRRVAGDPPSLSSEGVALSGQQRSADAVTAKVAAIGGPLPPAAWIGAKAQGPGFTLMVRRPLAVTAGTPARIEVVSVSPPRLPADGDSEALVEARVRDGWENPVAGAALAVAPSAGEVVSTRETAPGTYLVALRSPRRPGAGTVALAAGAARADVAITFVRPPSRLALAIGAGGAHNLGGLGSATGWVEGRRSIGAGESPWAAIVRVVGSRGAFEAPSPVETFDVSITQGLAFAGIRRRFTSPVSGWSLAAVVAVGTGTVQVAQTGRAGTRVGSGPVFGGRAALSAERSLGPGGLAVEAGYGVVRAERSLVRGNLGGVEVSVGYRHGF